MVSETADAEDAAGLARLARKRAAQAAPAVAKLHEQASVLVVGLPSFAAASSLVSAMPVLQWMHTLHNAVDELLEGPYAALWKFNATAGSFLVAAGVVADDAQHADVLVKFARALLERTKQWELPQGGKLRLRATVHSGTVAAGVIGTKALQYQVYGPVVDVAKAVNETATAGSLTVTENTHAMLCDSADWHCVGEFLAGGVRIKTYLQSGENLTDVAAASADATASPNGNLAACASSIDDATPRKLEVGKTAVPASSSGYDINKTDERTRWDLEFVSLLLENRYRVFFDQAMYKMDITFVAMIIICQLAWVLKWNFSSSSLGLVMAALVAFNCVHLLFMRYAPNEYVAMREPFAVLSHVIHKLVQLVITVTPPHGVVFHPSYTYTIALVESTGLAQIIMLAYGLRLRFRTQLAAGALMLALSVTANTAICASSVFAWSPASQCGLGLCLFDITMCYLMPCTLVYCLERKIRLAFLASDVAAM